MGGFAHFVVSSSPMIYFTGEVCSNLKGCVREKERDGGKAALAVACEKADLKLNVLETLSLILHATFL